MKMITAASMKDMESSDSFHAVLEGGCLDLLRVASCCVVVSRSPKFHFQILFRDTTTTTT